MKNHLRSMKTSVISLEFLNSEHFEFAFPTLKLEDEVFGYFTYEHDDYNKRMYRYFSLNYKPRTIHVTLPQQLKISKMSLELAALSVLNEKFGCFSQFANVTFVGYNGDDFVRDCRTFEITVK